MNLSDKTIKYLGNLISGNSGITEYKTGLNLVDFFNGTGLFHDSYSEGFPSRWKYVEDNLKIINKTIGIETVIKKYFHPINFIEKEQNLDKAIEEFNKYLVFDNYEIKIKNNKVIILSRIDDVVEIKNENKIESEFSKEQIIKCEEKILNGDYDGAITNARSLLEDVVKNLYKKVTGKELISKGDLSKDYSELKKELNLSENTNVDSSIKQITSGLTSVINGLAAVRNKMSDGHSRETKPQKHHAKLVVNCAKTFVDFLYDTVGRYPKH